MTIATFAGKEQESAFQQTVAALREAGLEIQTVAGVIGVVQVRIDDFDTAERVLVSQ